MNEMTTAQIVVNIAATVNVGLCIFSIVQIVQRKRRMAATIKELRDMIEKLKAERELERKEREVKLDHADQLLKDARQIWGDVKMNARSIENVRLIFDQEGVIRCPHCFSSVIREDGK